MKIQTFSVVVGTHACNAKCPFCVSKMTQSNSATNIINYRNFKKACLFAKHNGVSTALITGKGEPSLFQNDIIDVCNFLEKYRFPFIELQTNGYNLNSVFLRELYNLGMTTIIVSMVHYDDEKNNEIYQHKSVLKLKELIKTLHTIGLSVRLSCIMLKGYIDSVKEVENLIDFSKQNNVEQLTIRSVEIPEISINDNVYQWTKEHKINKFEFAEICEYFNNNSKLLLNLAHEAKVYDYKNQNLCISTCLTLDPDPENIRQLIFFPDGHLRYDWVYKGAILI